MNKHWLLLGCFFGATKAQLSDCFIAARDGIQLYTLYLPATTKKKSAPTIVWVHGFAQHSHRALCAMEYAASCGYACISYDARGHGRSQGVPGYIDSFDITVNDLEDVCNAYRLVIRGPLFVVAHSMGGLTAIRALERNACRFKAAVLTSPFLGPNCIALPLHKQHFLKALAICMPTLAIPVDSKDYHFTHDVALSQEFSCDSCLGKVVTPGGFVQAMYGAHCALRDACDIRTPLHILAAGREEIVDIEKTKQFYACLPACLDKSLTIYPELYHSLLDECERYQIYQAICSLCNKYCKA